MRNDTLLTEAGKQYATEDLLEALELYRNIIATHSNTQEDKYSRSQIQNIVNAVVPKQVLFDTQVDLALAHFEHGDQPDVIRFRSCYSHQSFAASARRHVPLEGGDFTWSKDIVYIQLPRKF